MRRHSLLRLFVAFALLVWQCVGGASAALAQAGYVQYGAVTTASPSYAPGTNQPVSIDTIGNLRVNCVIGCTASAGAQQGQASSSPPTYVSGTPNPLSLDLNGGLRVTDEANGAVGGGAAGSKSMLGGGIFNSTAPSLANGQQAALQLDNSGNLKVNIAQGAATGGTSSNFNAAAPTAGTAAGAVYNSSPPNFTSGNMVPLQTDVNGNLKVNIAAGAAAGGTSSSFGATFPTIGTAAGAEYLSSPPTLTSGQMVPLQTDASGNLKINLAAGVIAATTAGPVAPGTAAAQSNLGGLVYNSTAPTFTTGQQGALQGDINGNLKVANQAATPAGNNFIGDVGGFTSASAVGPTTTANSAYTAGFCVGGLMTFINAARASGRGTGLVQSVTIADSTGQDAAMDLVLFSTNPINSNFVDHAACNVAPADEGNIIGIVHVTDCAALGTGGGLCQALQLALPYTLGSGNTQMWGVLITRGTPTYAGANNVFVKIAFLED